MSKTIFVTMNRKKLSSFGFVGLFETGDVTTFFTVEISFAQGKINDQANFSEDIRAERKKSTRESEENEDASVKRH